MVWPEDIARDLPNPHPEEPARLRSDILDELNDHLQSSLEHEQLTEADADAARKSVLSRFGNPATIACRLWWDAMWGRIVMQRITLVFVTLVCCLSIVMTFMVWHAIENSQLAMQKSQEATAALVAQVQKLAERGSAQPEPEDDRFKFLEWLPVTVRLKDEEGAPVSDRTYFVDIEGQNMSGSGEMDNYTGHPDENGVVDFGLIKPGMRKISVSKPGFARMNQRSYSFRPGKPVELEITCPRELFSWSEKTLGIQWPDELQDQGLWVYLQLIAQFRNVDGKYWAADQEQQKSVSVLVDPHGRFYMTELFADEELKTPWASLVDQPLPFELLSFAITGDRPESFPSLINVINRSNGRVDPRNFRQYLEQLSDTIEHAVYADLSQPRDEISLVQTGMAINDYTILKRQTTDAGEDRAAFVNIVPQNDRYGEQVFEFVTDPANPSAREADRWRYRPKEEIVELIRKRLEQIESEGKPEDEGNTEAAEVSAETD